MAKDTRGSKGWPKLWAKLEQKGNIGLDYCISPVLYPKLCQALGRIENATLVDFGAGTNILAIQLLFGYEDNVPALAKCKNLEKARRNVRQVIGLEQSAALVAEARKYHRDLGYPSSIAINRMDVARGNRLPFKSSSIDLAVSRNFLMHLSNQDLAYHLKETARVLGQGSSYLLAVLNPEYEQRKHEEAGGEKLLDARRYEFLHGKQGESGIFFHYYRTQETYERMFRKDFQISSVTPCRPISKEFKTGYPRYYWPDCPMAYVYELKKKA